MTRNTIQILNNLNKEFYIKIAPYFDTSRQIPWEGWENLWNFILENDIKVTDILDIACGNARFYKFLQNKINTLCHNLDSYSYNIRNLLNNKFEYLGIDNNQYLLNSAFSDNKNYTLENRDIFSELYLPKKYNLITAFGIMHHIAGFDERIKFLNNLKNNLNSNGIIVVSIWKFKKAYNFAKLHVNFEDLNKFDPEIEINQQDLEQEDYFLSWQRGEKAVRFCHYITDAEEKKLLAKTNLKVLKSFYADGKNKKSNKYLILYKL